jgi:aminoglycoside phosphotransferase (APT) family kinase protein
MAGVDDWWDERKKWVRTRPSRDGLRAVARAVVPGAEPVFARRLGGGIGTASSMVRLRTRSGRTTDVVLKRYPERGPDPVAEWKRLTYAMRLPVPTPEPIALDLEGRWFGVPALVMSKLPGRPYVAPSRLDTWLDEIARTQFAIHSAGMSRLPVTMRVPLSRTPYAPPQGLRRTTLVREAMEYITPRYTRAKQRDLVVAHGDAHPGNLLWSRGRISGVLDWAHARTFPRARELSYTRVEIAVLVDHDAADDYLDRYESLLGRRVPGLAMWDVAQGLNGIRFGPMWAYAYREQRADLSDEQTVRRAAAFVRRVLNERH